MKTSKLFNRSNALRFALILALGVVAVGCDDKDDFASPANQQNESRDIMEVLVSYDQIATVNEDGDSKSTLSRPTSFSTLNVALAKTGLAGTVSRNRLTVFAPTDEAFAELGLNPGNIGDVPNLKDILLYHVVAGMVYSYQLSNGFVPTLNGAAVEIDLSNGVMVNDANVIAADIKARNGVIHAIDKVLFPPTQNIVEIAAANEDFSILVAAVVAAELDGVLSGDGPFTVFAPTNAAFMALPAGTIEALLADPKGALTDILLYHVVEGRVFSSDLTTGPVTSIGGETFDVNTANLTITDQNSQLANIIAVNIQGTNGVIHVIDKVILP